MLDTYGDAQPSSSSEQGMIYGPGYPAGVTDPDALIVTQGQVPGADRGDWPEGVTRFIDYIHASEGGKPGTAYRNGYTSGIDKYNRNVHHFTGRAVRFVTRDLRGDTGPVGTDNYRSQLAAGVDQQFLEASPSLEDIYYGITGRG